MAAYNVKKLVHQVTTGTMASVFPDTSDDAGWSFSRLTRVLYAEDHLFPGHPFALMEVRPIHDNHELILTMSQYHAPCFLSPFLTMLLMPISLSTRNILSTPFHSATYTLSMPMDYAPSPMSRGRVALIGNVTILPYESIPEPELKRLEKCYTWYHPDAVEWLPYQDQHPFNSFWARFEPKDIYYVGGFGE